MVPRVQYVDLVELSFLMSIAMSHGILCVCSCFLCDHPCLMEVVDKSWLRRPVSVADY